MARVARGHGGDGAGDPPAPYWKPESGCLASGKKLRSYAKNLELEKLRIDNGAPLDIEFDIRTKTYNPVGPNAKYFTPLLGTLARSVPFYYDSWDHVPEEAKEHVWPCLEYFFNLSPYIQELDPNNTIRKGVKKGVTASLKKYYRNGKSRFKSDHFSKKGGVRNEGNIRANPPVCMDPLDWNNHVDFFVSEGSVRRSQVNKANRALQSDIPTQGRTTFAQRQRGIFGPITAYPSLFATWAESHRHEDGSWISELRAQQHAEMLTRWDETRNDDNPPTEAEIVTFVEGAKAGWNRGIGRVVPGLGSSGYSSTDSGPSDASTSRSQRPQFTTQEDMLALEARMKRQLDEQAQENQLLRETLQSQQSTMTQMMEYMRSQGFNISPQPQPPPDYQPSPQPGSTHLDNWNNNELEFDEDGNLHF